MLLSSKVNVMPTLLSTRLNNPEAVPYFMWDEVNHGGGAPFEIDDCVSTRADASSGQDSERGTRHGYLAIRFTVRNQRTLA